MVGMQCIMDYKVCDPEDVARGGGTLSSIMHVPNLRHLIYILIGLCHSNKLLNYNIIEVWPITLTIA